MSEGLRETVKCADGSYRTFHRSGLHSHDGFVYASGHRVYGERFTYLSGPSVFVAKGKHAWLVKPAPSNTELANA